VTRRRGDAATNPSRWSPRPRVPASPCLFLAATFLLLACTRSDAEQETLEFWGLGREGEVVAELMPEFERRTGIRVNVQQIPWSAAHEKLLTAYVGESVPDIAQMGNTWIPEFVAIDAFEDLSPWIARSEVVKPEEYFAGIWATNVIEDRPYGVPWYVDTRLLFYRSDILAAAGWPGAPRTWSEWMEAMEDIRKGLGPGQYPLLLPTNEFEQPIILGLQAQSPILREGGRFGKWSGPEFTRAFDFYLEIFRRNYAPPLSAHQIANLYQQFGEGDFAMFISGPWNVGELRKRLPESAKDKWMTAPWPAPDGLPWPGASIAGGSSLVIFEGSRRKEAAWKLVEFLSETQQQVRFFELTGNLPARRAAWDAPVFVKDRHMAAFRQQLENVVPVPKVPEWQQIAMTLPEYIDAALRGQMTPAEALAALDRKTDRILAKRRWVLERESERALALSHSRTSP
jgi:multiple sugar transport system substrate-binding protein